MNITVKTNDSMAVISLEGRLDTVSSPDLEAVLEKMPENVNSIEFDFARLDYVSSAGLRVLLSTQKKFKQVGGHMSIANICPTVQEVFDITGFTDILSIA